VRGRPTDEGGREPAEGVAVGRQGGRAVVEAPQGIVDAHDLGEQGGRDAVSNVNGGEGGRCVAALPPAFRPSRLRSDNIPAQADEGERCARRGGRYRKGTAADPSSLSGLQEWVRAREYTPGPVCSLFSLSPLPSLPALRHNAIIGRVQASTMRSMLRMLDEYRVTRLAVAAV